MKTAIRFALALVALAPVACDQPDDQPDTEPRLAFASHEEIMILEFVNSTDTDLDVLDVEVKLDARAAQNIIELRNGPDGVFPTLDDFMFETMDDLDAVPYVGNSALAALRDYALANPGTPSLQIEGVHFTGTQAQAVVWGVNQATIDYLDDVVDLDPRAAEQLVANAPYTDMHEIAAIGYVGTRSLEKLRHQANAWLEAMGEGPDVIPGSYDGVTFDAATAANALEIANEASFDDLVGAGMWTTGARRIVENRPHVSLAAVAAVPGVGTETMADLKAIAGGD